MPRFLQFWKRRAAGGPAPAGKPRPGAGRFTAVVSVAALASLCFLLGAATMHFNLPTSGFLRKAFSGAETWFASATASAGLPSGDLSQAEVTGDRPEATFDGFTLFTTTQGAEATLIDMRGRPAHRWKLPERRPWPLAPGARDPRADEPVHWERCHLYPNGDLLALCCSGTGTPYGYGLAKLDRNSRLLWGFSGNVHHAFDVAEDGRVYALTDRAGVVPPDGLDPAPPPYIADTLVILSPNGQLLDTIPILEAFVDSPYLLALLSGDLDPHGPFPPAPPGSPPGMPGGPPAPPGAPPLPSRLSPTPAHGDILHTNSVKVLSRALGPAFPQFKPGQVLLSLRSPSLLAVLDTQTRRVVWAAKGVWMFQHDAQFLDNGNLLLFDNAGSTRGSRVLEYHPATQAIPWSYAGDKAAPITTIFRGANQRLPNGNTLIVNSDGLRLVEATRGKQAVWQWHCPIPPAPPAGANVASLSITSARRYGPDELTFLKGTPHERPR